MGQEQFPGPGKAVSRQEFLRGLAGQGLDLGEQAAAAHAHHAGQGGDVEFFLGQVFFNQSVQFLDERLVVGADGEVLEDRIDLVRRLLAQGLLDTAPVVQQILHQGPESKGFPR